MTAHHNLVTGHIVNSCYLVIPHHVIISYLVAGPMVNHHHLMILHHVTNSNHLVGHMVPSPTW